MSYKINPLETGNFDVKFKSHLFMICTPCCERDKPNIVTGLDVAGGNVSKLFQGHFETASPKYTIYSQLNNLLNT